MRLRQAGDGAMLAEFSLRLDPAAAARARGLEGALLRAAPEGLIETSPGLRSLLVVYDPLRLSARRLSALLEALAEAPEAAPPPAAEWLIPVCYAPEFGLDIAEVAARTGLSAEEVVLRHRAPSYAVVAVGSFPGLPYLAGLDPALALPRRAPPRLEVAAGTVAIALEMCIVYSQATPGGWNILGRTPAPLFDANWAQPALVSPGDTLRFRPIARAEHDALARGYADGNLRPQRECRA
jgi:KipI family sensor histidine kinase inhibitor